MINVIIIVVIIIIIFYLRSEKYSFVNPYLFIFVHLIIKTSTSFGLYKETFKLSIRSSNFWRSRPLNSDFVTSRKIKKK